MKNICKINESTVQHYKESRETESKDCGKKTRLKIHSKAIRVNTYTAALISLNIYKYFSFVIVEIEHRRECSSEKITPFYTAEVIHSLISSEACDHSK